MKYIEWLIEREVPLLEKCFHGRTLEFSLRENCVSEWFIPKGAENMANFLLSVHDCDDFGGPIFYFVPQEQAEEVKAALIQWIEDIAELGIDDISDCYQFDSFYPQFPNCLMGNNW